MLFMDIILFLYTEPAGDPIGVKIPKSFLNIVYVSSLNAPNSEISIPMISISFGTLSRLNFFIVRKNMILKSETHKKIAKAPTNW